MRRILHLVSIVCLVAAAVSVYKLKYGSTYEAQQAAKLRAEIRTERERIALLRAEWTRLAAPARIQDLAARHLGMKPLAVSRIDNLASLPEKPRGPEDGDPIGEYIEKLSANEPPLADPVGDLLQSFIDADEAATGAVGGGN